MQTSSPAPKSAPIPTEEMVSRLATVPLLQGLSADDLIELAPQIETRRYRKGETLFKRGDPGGALYIVSNGHVQLFIHDDNNEEVILEKATIGEFFGEATLFNGLPRTANAIATEPTVIFVVSRTVIAEFLMEHPQAALQMIGVLGERLKDTTTLFTDKTPDATTILLRQMNVWERIAERGAAIMGSWLWLSLLLVFMAAWMLFNTYQVFGGFDKPPEFFLLMSVLTVIGAVATPLILISQRRQARLGKIQAELDRQRDLKSDLAILELNKKLDWLQETTVGNTGRLDSIERETGKIRESQSGRR